MLSGSRSVTKSVRSPLLFTTNKYTIYVEWTGKQNYVNNTTTITANFYISADYVNVLFRDCWLDIHGRMHRFQIDSNLAINILGVPKTLVYTATEEIPHDDDGRADIIVGAGWKFGLDNSDEVSFSRQWYILDQIDRKPPKTNLVSVQDILMDGFSVYGTSDTSVDEWSYSVDNGKTWVIAGGESTSINYAVIGLAKETEYEVQLRCRRAYNGVYGYSGILKVKTIGSTILNSATFGDADDDVVEGTVNLTVLDVHYHKLVFGYDGKELFTTAGFGAVTGNNTIVLTENERKIILSTLKNLKTGLFSVTINTYLDEGCTNQLSTVSSVMVILNTSEKSKPVFTDFTYEDSVQAVVDVTGNNQVLVQNYSNLIVHCVPAIPLNESTIVSYEASISKNYVKSPSTELDVGSIPEDGEITLSVTCTDSRGYSTTVEKDIRVISYDDPNISSITLRRKDGVDKLIELSFNGMFSKIDADGENDTNRLTEVKYRYKRKKDEEYGEYISLFDRVSVNENYFSFESKELEEFEIESSYDFQIVITDRLGNLSVFEATYTLNKLTPSIAIRTANSQYPFTRVGINNNSPVYPLDVGGAIAMNSSVVLGYCGTLKDGETIRSKLKGGIYLYDASYEASDAPEKVPAIVEAVCAGNFSVIRFITLDENCSVYVTSFTGSSWSLWKKL